jgi:hypothetical protein
MATASALFGEGDLKSFWEGFIVCCMASIGGENRFAFS